MEAFHAQKWSASATPPPIASRKSPKSMRRHSRHCLVATRKAPTMRREKPSRQTAIATGSAAESRTSGPANEIPSTASPRTQNGFFDMPKKKPVRLSTGSFFEEP